MFLSTSSQTVCKTKLLFGRGNVWRIAELEVIGKIKFGEWIDFGHEDTIYQLKFGRLKFGESRITSQIHQTFPLYGITRNKTNTRNTYIFARSKLMKGYFKVNNALTFVLWHF